MERDALSLSKGTPHIAQDQQPALMWTWYKLGVFFFGLFVIFGQTFKHFARVRKGVKAIFPFPCPWDNELQCSQWEKVWLNLENVIWGSSQQNFHLALNQTFPYLDMVIIISTCLLISYHINTLFIQNNNCGLLMQNNYRSDWNLQVFLAALEIFMDVRFQLHHVTCYFFIQISHYKNVTYLQDTILLI